LKPENEQVLSLIKNVFKEASKKSANVDINYKITSMRCLSDLMQYSASNSLDSDFELYWTMFVEKYFEQDFLNLKNAEELKVEINAEAMQLENNITDNDRPIEEIKKLKLSETKSNDDEENEELFNKLKLIILETIGKCWPYTMEMQGTRRVLFIL
jgi:hypothetical protein